MFFLLIAPTKYGRGSHITLSKVFHWAPNYSCESEVQFWQGLLLKFVLGKNVPSFQIWITLQPLFSLRNKKIAPNRKIGLHFY